MTAPPSLRERRVTTPSENRWKTLDKDLGQVGLIEDATRFVARPLVAPGLAAAFIVLAGIVAAFLAGFPAPGLLLTVAAVIAAYMALNIGANDVANTMGAPVGAGALTLGQALLIAAICEAAGALIAGGPVVGTLSNDILDPQALEAPRHLVWAMLAAMLAAAAWLHLATWIGASVSTTHSIVGGIVGAGIAAGGPGAVHWGEIGFITLGWMTAPVIAGAAAAALLAFLERRVTEADDRIAAARFWLPILVGAMVGAFAIYLVSSLWPARPIGALGIGLVTGGLCAALWAPVLRRQTDGAENRKRALRPLFGLPLALAAGMMSFAHGANDVSNAIGPLAAIVGTLKTGTAAAPAPFWVMLVGALGISVGLLTFGPRLIRLIGTEITRLNPLRACCVALASAVTVLLASWLGLPVSTTHVSVGAIFGIGFYREWRSLRRPTDDALAPPEERTRRKLVRRSYMLTLISAWAVTMPASALLSALLFTAIAAVSG